MSPDGVALPVPRSRSRGTGFTVAPALPLAVADQAGRPDTARAEPGAGPVDRPVGVAPAVVGLVEGALDGGTLALDEPFHPHAHEPDPGALETQGVVETLGRVEDLAADVGGVAQGAAAGDGGEVGEP